MGKLCCFCCNFTLRSGNCWPSGLYTSDVPQNHLIFVRIMSDLRLAHSNSFTAQLLRTCCMQYIYLFWIRFYSSFTGLYLLHQTQQDLKLDASPWFMAQTRDCYTKNCSALHFSWPRLQPFLGCSISRKSKYCFSPFQAFSENPPDVTLHIWVGYFICVILFKANNRNNLKSLMVR